MDAIIRTAAPADITSLPDIERSAAETFRSSSRAWIVDHDVTPAEAYPPHVAAGTVWVAEAAGELVGFCLSEPFDDGLHVWELAVAHPHQGRGLGRRLMAESIAAARARGLPAVTLTTFEDIPWNAPFYRRLGFEALAQERAGERLTEVLAKEAERGLTQRCAMRLALA